MKNIAPEAMEEGVGLRDEGVYEECVGKGTPWITPDEGHEEAKPDEHHHIDILEAGVALSDKAVCWIFDLISSEDPHEGCEDQFENKQQNSEFS